MRALPSAPASPSVGEFYFDTTQNMAYIYNGSQWNEYRGPQGIQGEVGPQGSPGPQGPQGPQGSNNFAPSGRMRDCVFYNHPPGFPTEIIVLNWPLDWSIDACKNLVCGCGWQRWEVNEIYSNGSISTCINGGCGNCP